MEVIVQSLPAKVGIFANRKCSFSCVLSVAVNPGSGQFIVATNSGLKTR